jgi:hypothetical protein
VETDVFACWTVYESPSDFPGLYVVRRWGVLSGAHGPVTNGEAQTFATLAEARAPLQEQGLYRIPRDVTDDPCIVESWV